MARRCQVCDHRSLRRIDAALLRGDTFVSVARRYKLSKFSVSRHHRHIKTALIIAREERQRNAAYGDDLLSELGRIIADCERLQLDAERRQDLRSALAGITPRLKALELKAKLTGQVPEQRDSVQVFNQQFNQLNIVPACEDADLEIALLMQKITDNFAPQEIERYRSLANGQAQPSLMGETS